MSRRTTSPTTDDPPRSVQFNKTVEYQSTDKKITSSVFDRIGGNDDSGSAHQVTRAAVRKISPPRKIENVAPKFANTKLSIQLDNDNKNGNSDSENKISRIPTFFHKKYSNITDDDWHELDELLSQHNVNTVSGLKKQLKLLKRRQKLGSKESLVETEKKCEEFRKKAEQLEAQLVANSTDASEVKWENHHLKQRLANQPNADTNSDEVKTILAAKDTIYEEIHSKYKTQTLEYKLLQESFMNLKNQYCKQLDSANEIKQDQQTKIFVLEDQTVRLREQLAEAREQAEREVVAVPLKRSSRENSSDSGISKREFNALHEKYSRYAKKNNELHDRVDNLHSKNAELHHKIGQISLERDDVRTILNDTEKRLSAEETRHRENLQSSEDRLERLMKNVDSKRRDEQSTLNGKVHHATKNLERELAGQRKMFQKKNEEAQAKEAELSVMIEELEIQLEDMRNKANAVLKEKSPLLKELQKYKTSAAVLGTENDQKSLELTTIQAKLTIAQKEAAKLYTTEREKNDLEKKYEFVSAERVKEHQKMRNQNNLIGELEEKLRAVDQNINNLKRDALNREVELGKLKAKSRLGNVLETTPATLTREALVQEVKQVVKKAELDPNSMLARKMQEKKVKGNVEITLEDSTKSDDEEMDVKTDGDNCENYAGNVENIKNVENKEIKPEQNPEENSGVESDDSKNITSNTEEPEQDHAIIALNRIAANKQKQGEKAALWGGKKTAMKFSNSAAKKAKTLEKNEQLTKSVVGQASYGAKTKLVTEQNSEGWSDDDDQDGEDEGMLPFLAGNKKKLENNGYDSPANKVTKGVPNSDFEPVLKPAKRKSETEPASSVPKRNVICYDNSRAKPGPGSLRNGLEIASFAALTGNDELKPEEKPEEKTAAECIAEHLQLVQKPEKVWGNTKPVNKYPTKTEQVKSKNVEMKKFSYMTTDMKPIQKRKVPVLQQPRSFTGEQGLTSGNMAGSSSFQHNHGGAPPQTPTGQNYNQATQSSPFTTAPSANTTSFPLTFDSFVTNAPPAQQQSHAYPPARARMPVPNFPVRNQNSYQFQRMRGPPPRPIGNVVPNLRGGAPRMRGNNPFQSGNNGQAQQQYNFNNMQSRMRDF